MLKISYEECLKIDITSIDNATLKSLEALSIRFTRLTNLLSKRLLASIDLIEMTDEGSYIDKLNRAEKRGIIKSTIEFKEIDDLINRFWDSTDPSHLYADMLAYSPTLLETAKNCKTYSQKYLG